MTFNCHYAVLQTAFARLADILGCPRARLYKVGILHSSLMLYAGNTSCEGLYE